MKAKLPAFDVLVDMARNEPDRLEALRNRLTGEVINGATSEEQRRRLAGLQFQVNMERERSRSPLHATIRISEMMCRSLAELHRSMVTPLVDENHPAQEARYDPDSPKAKVLEFKRKEPTLFDEDDHPIFIVEELIAEEITIEDAQREEHEDTVTD